MKHFPPHWLALHCGVGVGGGAGGTHSQVPESVVAHFPRSAKRASGHAAPGGQGAKMTQSPPHISPPHCGVGVGSADGRHSQLPAAVISHCPRTG
jgi:hypothetical protein